MALYTTAGFAILGQKQYPWAAVPGGRFSNPPTSQSPIVGSNF
jgi:hypothetical protein